VKTFIEFIENVSSWTLFPRDVYNFYYIFSAYSYGKLYDEDKNKAEFILNEIKQKYLKNFKLLLVHQLEKYASSGRVDDDFLHDELSNDMDFQKIKTFISKTYRSDMKRKNDNWIALADYCDSLNKTNVFDKICFFIDRINNTVHNTGAAMLDKLPSGLDLIDAFETVHLAQTPRQYAKHTSSEVRKLARWV